MNQGRHNGHASRHERKCSHGAILVALELGMDVRHGGQCPENPNLLTDEDGVRPDYQSRDRKAEHMEIN